MFVWIKLSILHVSSHVVIDISLGNHGKIVPVCHKILLVITLSNIILMIITNEYFNFMQGQTALRQSVYSVAYFV